MQLIVALFILYILGMKFIALQSNALQHALFTAIKWLMQGTVEL